MVLVNLEGISLLLWASGIRNGSKSTSSRVIMSWTHASGDRFIESYLGFYVALIMKEDFKWGNS